jgi:hypothetical protein
LWFLDLVFFLLFFLFFLRMPLALLPRLGILLLFLSRWKRIFLLLLLAVNPLEVLLVVAVRSSARGTAL